MFAHSSTQEAVLSDQEIPAADSAIAPAAPPGVCPLSSPLPLSTGGVGLRGQTLNGPQASRLPPRQEQPVVLRRTWYVNGKTVLDVGLIVVLSVVALPVLLLTAVLVKLTSRGPVFYSQIRLGRDGRPFSIYKVRTMVHDCERSSGARWSQPGDPRVTPLGRVLRLTHLDELPQLWNILRGDMSLVGPRPERPEFVPVLEQAIPNYRARLQVRPGLTGLAQVQLPPDSDIAGVRRKVAHDLAYIRHFSCWLDLRILFCTTLHVFGIPCHRLCRLLLGERPA
jgi:lipopolysaccharide/colanic/teichoic acid biosynthesis glycosyltransferase